MLQVFFIDVVVVRSFVISYWVWGSSKICTYTDFLDIFYLNSIPGDEYYLSCSLCPSV